MSEEDDLLPLSALEHFVFCARQCALIHIEQSWRESQATVEGRHLHDRAHDSGTEVRGDVRIARGLRLRSLKLGLSGMADVVEFHFCVETPDPMSNIRSGVSQSGVRLDGVTGLWQPFPVEYKRGRLRHERGYEVQLCAQAICLEEMLGCCIPAGALFYGKTARRMQVAFDDKLRSETEAAAARLHELLTRKETPAPTYIKKKCAECSLHDLCMPEAAGSRRSARAYLSRFASEGQEP